MIHEVLQVHPSDNVLVALTNLQPLTTVTHMGEKFELLELIPAKHKFFTTSLSANEPVIMYGVLIGKTTCNVQRGQRVSTENVHHASSEYGWKGVSFDWQPPDISNFEGKTFMGYHRSDGRVGTANYWLFIPTVFCENRNLEVIKESLQQTLGYATSHKYRDFADQLLEAYQRGETLEQVDFSPTPSATARFFKNIDGIKFLFHQGGCGGIRQDAATLSKLLVAYADHPNVAGITLLSLGCQNLQVADFQRDLAQYNPAFDKPLYIFEQQAYASEELLIADAIRSTFNGLIAANNSTRKPAGLDKLCIGVKCGGSDGFSGITANPAVGYCADLLVALGGKVLLAEFPELCGVEQELINRTQSQAHAEKFIRLMKNYESQVIAAGSSFSMNPSPGNIKDGLITDAMKSAGAAKKGGTSPVVDVLEYTEPATKPGLSLVLTPGNDVEATTGKVASGATLILFTTGLGTPTGNPICPTIKLATNTQLANRMSDIIDINCGSIIDEGKTIQQMGEEILAYCIRAASGEITPKAVLLNQDDFIPWKRGVSL